MASVKMSRDLRSDILTLVRKPYDERIRELITKAVDNFGQQLPEFRGAVINWLCKNHGMDRELYDSLPTGWVPEFETVTVTSINGIGTSNIGGTVKFKPGLLVPASVAGRGYYSSSFAVTGPEFDVFSEPIARLNTKVAEIGTEQRQVSHAVEGILNQSTTLKQAIEIYPAIERWVPQWALDKMREPSVRKERAAAVRQKVDLSVITTALLRDKIDSMTASNG